MRKCSTCQHPKRAEIDRRLAGGEPGNSIARDYALNPSSLHRHRVNCLGLANANALMKEVARGSAAIALLPTKDKLASGYDELRVRIDEIVKQAEKEGSLKIAISGLNSIRQTLDSLARLAGHGRPTSGEAESATETIGSSVDTGDIAARLIKYFDHEPELKARIAQALFDMADNDVGDDDAGDDAGDDVGIQSMGGKNEPMH